MTSPALEAPFSEERALGTAATMHSNAEKNFSGNDTQSDVECILRDASGNPMIKMYIPATTFSICVLGNLFAVVFLWRSNQRSDKKQHIFYTLVMTLACCDLLSCVMTSPLTFVAYISGHCVMELGGLGLCRYSGFAMTFFGVASVAIVFAMSLERFIAIRFSLFYQTWMTTHKTRVFLLFIVVFLIIVSALPLVGFGEVAQQMPGSWCFLNWKSRVLRHQIFNFLVVFLGMGMMIGTIVCNIFVVARVSKVRRKMHDQNSSHKLMSKGRRRKMRQQENQMMVLMGLMTIVFVVCYLPLLLRILVNQISSIRSEEFATSNLSNWDLFAVRMAAINPIVDPWVYILCRRTVLSKAFRLLKLAVTCRCNGEEFQKVFMSSREFRRQKSTIRHFQTSVTSVHSNPSIKRDQKLSVKRSEEEPPLITNINQSGLASKEI